MAWRIFRLVRRALTSLSLPYSAEVIHRIDVKIVKSGSISIQLKRRNDELFVVMNFSAHGEGTSCQMDVKEFMALTEAMLVTKSVIQNTKNSD